MTSFPSPKEQQVLDLIEASFSQGLRTPSMKEIAEALGNSQKTIETHIRRLRTKGYLPKKLPDERTGETKVVQWLWSRGLTNIQQTKHQCPYDAVWRGIKIEIKTARYIDGHWRINIQRQGIVNESQVDFYVFRLEGLPELKKSHAIHFVLRAPLRTPTFKLTLRTVITRWAKHFNRVQLIRDFANKHKTTVRPLEAVAQGHSPTIS